ncbi:hypothetical protein D9758_011163 [Tetrapyrgos nigripes]|uniref:Uncharacterized protein n=1 Tax=Tetrapyrgos nigripes TaxID=182062 RepID=A0A8H5CKK8_9AGAR|nr:hypothetical protein D9758_011163 [Tetrapyrgos nigripes]
MLSMLASVDRLPADTRERLGIFVKRAIMWDPPAQILGIRSPEGTYIPLEDENLSPEARLVEFRKWVTYYFVHGDLSARDPMQLNYKTPDPDRKPTFEHLPIQELLSLVDLAPGQKCDTVVCEPAFADVEWGIVNKALFDRDVRATWSSMTMWHIFGDACPWNVYLAAWRLEDEAKKSDLAVNFTMTRGANHFVGAISCTLNKDLTLSFQPMWDNPEGALSELSKLV